jgi:oligopeptide/dipeptide ABC transporter ATP-binding protein
MEKTILAVKGLKTCFYTDGSIIAAVDNVNFTLREGETLGIVGESGCGKSVTALSILGLIPDPPGKIVSGEILFDGRDLLKMSSAEIRKIRGNKISMIFQEPMTSLNPVFTIGRQITEVIRLHQGMNKKEAEEKAVEMLQLVSIPLPEKIIHQYPHQLSGGMLQRVMIAIALACTPKILIADEPTTALDVTVQSQILEVMQELKEKIGTSIILITHDLGVVSGMAQNSMVMYAGKVVEYADSQTLFDSPLHPYTVGLLHSIPRIKRPLRRLHAIRGTVPSLKALPRGCFFNPRCDEVMSLCREQAPELKPNGNGRWVRCWKYAGGGDA